MLSVKPYPNIVVEFNPENHRFLVKEGKNEFRPPSVTAITRIIDKSNVLIPWAVRMMKEYLVENWDSKKCQTETEILELIERASQEHKIKKDVAATLGKMVHKWCEQFTSGKNPPLPKNEQVKNGVVAFLKWIEDNKVKFLEPERIIYSKKWKFAGITDCIAKIGGKFVLLDYKTGSGIYPEMSLQTAGYQLAFEEETGQKIDRRIIIQFDKETGGFHEKEFTENDEDKKAFISALVLSNRIKELQS